MQVITHRKHAVNITQAERIASAVGGGILAAAALKRRSPASIALALIGGDLLRRGITGHSFAYEALGIRTADKGQGAETTSVPYELGIRVDKSITIGRPPREVYDFWKDLNNLTRFMKNVESVTAARGRAVALGGEGARRPQGRVGREIHNEIDGEMIAWRSLPGAACSTPGRCGSRKRPPVAAPR